MKTVSRAVITVLSLAAGAVCAQPDLAGFWTPSFVPPAEGQVLVDKLPLGAIMIDDAGGGELGEGEYGGLQLTDRAKAEVASYDYSVELSREYACTPP